MLTLHSLRPDPAATLADVILAALVNDISATWLEPARALGDRRFRSSTLLATPTTEQAPSGSARSRSLDA